MWGAARAISGLPKGLTQTQTHAVPWRGRAPREEVAQGRGWGPPPNSLLGQLASGASVRLSAGRHRSWGCVGKPALVHVSWCQLEVLTGPPHRPGTPGPLFARGASHRAGCSCGEQGEGSEQQASPVLQVGCSHPGGDLGGLPSARQDCLWALPLPGQLRSEVAQPEPGGPHQKGLPAEAGHPVPAMRRGPQTLAGWPSWAMGTGGGGHI